MRIIKDLKILWNDVSFNRSVKMLGLVMAVVAALFVTLWLLGVGIKADVFVNGRAEGIDLDGMRREAFDIFKEKPMSLAWANVYTVDNLATVLRQLGLKAVRSGTEQDFRRDMRASLAARDKLQGPILREFARVEHNRWMADRVLMGYLPHPQSPTKNDTYRWHDCLVGFDELSEENVRKDESSVKCRIFTLAMMGYHIEPKIGNMGDISWGDFQRE